MKNKNIYIALAVALLALPMALAIENVNVQCGYGSYAICNEAEVQNAVNDLVDNDEELETQIEEITNNVETLENDVNHVEHNLQHNWKMDMKQWMAINNIKHETNDLENYVANQETKWNTDKSGNGYGDKDVAMILVGNEKAFWHLMSPYKTFLELLLDTFATKKEITELQNQIADLQTRCQMKW